MKSFDNFYRKLVLSVNPGILLAFFQVLACKSQRFGRRVQGLLVTLLVTGAMPKTGSKSKVQILDSQPEEGRNESNG